FGFINHSEGVTDELDNMVVAVRLSGRDVRVVVDTRESRERGEPRETPPPPPPPPSGGGDITRMTLRLFEELKNKAEQAAAEQGASPNTFVQQALQGALQGKHPGSWSSEWQGGRPGDRGNGGNEPHGWVQS